MSKLTSATLSTVFLPSKVLSSTGLSSDVVYNHDVPTEVSSDVAPTLDVSHATEQVPTTEEVPAPTWRQWISKHSSFLYGVVVGGATTVFIQSILRKRR